VKGPYEYGSEVARAVAANAPVVALETTVVTHGLPHPDGVTTALALEQIIREAGATPATIGIIGGGIRIGLTRAELEQLATTPGVPKINLTNGWRRASTWCAGPRCRAAASQLRKSSSAASHFPAVYSGFIADTERHHEGRNRRDDHAGRDCQILRAASRSVLSEMKGELLLGRDEVRMVVVVGLDRDPIDSAGESLGSASPCLYVGSKSGNGQDRSK